MACFLGHKWVGCKCVKCGKARDKGHRWNGCTCTLCGKVRDEEHRWDGCTCEICGKVREGGRWHRFARFDESCNTRCERCGLEGVPEHNFVPIGGSCNTKCERCGKKGPVEHRWNKAGRGCKCEVCGEKRDTTDPDAHSFPYVFDPHYLGGKQKESCTCEVCGYVKPEDFAGHVYEYTFRKGAARHKGVCTICGKEIMSEHFFDNGVCTYCGYRPGVDLRKLVTDFATYVSLSLDETELDKMERQLLDEGDAAETAIFNFLAQCSYGGVGNIRWWSQAKRLTRMLPKFHSPEVKRHLAQLADNATRTNSWEYHTEIADVAKQELSKLRG